jgi:hypothetical protein
LLIQIKKIVEIEALKFAPPPLPSWKGGISRRDSISGLSVYSTPQFLGTQSPAPTFHSTGLVDFIVFLALFLIFSLKFLIENLTLTSNFPWLLWKQAHILE